MASASSIPRFLAPRLFLDPSRAILRRLPTQTRHASTNPPKPRVLEKPAKFNPPSHPQRLQRKIPRHYGPDLTAQERHVQQTKQYPAMMPPDGSWMRWFLTNRSIHMYITLVNFPRPSLTLPVNPQTTSTPHLVKSSKMLTFFSTVHPRLPNNPNPLLRVQTHLALRLATTDVGLPLHASHLGHGTGHRRVQAAYTTCEPGGG